MKNILIASYDMEVGGVERSLINMLDNFDYENNNVDLLLYSHSGDFFNLIPKRPNLLEENKKYKTIRMSIAEILRQGDIKIALARIIAKLRVGFLNSEDAGNIQMQYMWKYLLPFLPKVEKEYDAAISYLWPHDFVAEKVSAKTKIAWIHTDYSQIKTKEDLDLQIWDKFDYIVSISNDVTKSFLKKYPTLENKIVLVENITAPNIVISLSKENQNEIIKNPKYFNLLSIGRYCYAKGFDNAIKALKLLHEKGLTNIKWYIIGYGGDEDLLVDLIKENKLEDSFILLGKKINPYPYIKACDLYVQPSRYEGKAVTVTEAQILKKPVLITNYATANSQVENELNGYITPLSVEGIADGIEKLYKNESLRKKIINNDISYSNSEELGKLYKIIHEKN